jgi:hypothetical protein
MLKIPKPVHPVSRENYVLTQIEKTFPGGEWVDGTPQEEEAEVAEVPGCEPGGRGFESLTPLSVTVIGGTKYDADALEAQLAELPHGWSVISGGNRGAEKAALEIAERLGLTPVRVDVDRELFGAKATDVHVEQVLGTELHSKLIIAGNGVRPKQAKSWLNRAKWPREVVTL